MTNEAALAGLKSSGEIAVALSGGVDSAVTALLLKRHGWRVRALFMKNWEEDDRGQDCSAHEDLHYAQSVCSQLDIPLDTINFSHEYWERVFTDFIAGYQRGRTPNPDVVCNREIKFSLLLEYAHSLGIERLATGHYAGIQCDNHLRYLLQGIDAGKDQSYFLYQLNQAALRCAVFPLADYHKSAVRAVAHKHHLANAERRDSTGLCFIGERPFRSFLARFIAPQRGDIVDENGRLLGQHDGVWFYTIGQRSGLGIGGVADVPDGAWYVASKDIHKNQLTVVQQRNHPALLRVALPIEQLHWIATAPAADTPLLARIRYRQQASPCSLQAHPHDSRRATVHFTEPQWAAAAGQSLVFYYGRRCLGGGIICDM